MFESQIHLQCSTSDGIRQECQGWVWDVFGEGMQSVQWVVVELTWYIDIFYMDVKGWVKLTDMYAELNLCMQVFSVCVVLMLGQVHTLTAGPHACAAAHGTEPVPAAFHGDSIHGRRCAPCTQDIPLWVHEQWFHPVLCQHLTHIVSQHVFPKKKKKKCVGQCFLNML